MNIKQGLISPMVPIGLCALIFLVMVPSFAQEAILIGENRLINVSGTGVTALTLDTTIGQGVILDALSITPGLVPEMVVKDLDGSIIKTIVNPIENNRVSDSLILNRAGPVVVEIYAVNGVDGEIVVSVQEAAPVPTTPLQLNRPIQGRLNSDQPIQQYSFDRSPAEALILDIQNQGATILVQDDDAGEIVASVNDQVAEAQFLFAPGASNYVMIAHYSDVTPEDRYTLELQTESGAVANIDPAPQAAESACLVSPRSQNVNFRRAPGLGAAIVGRLRVGSEAEMIGRLPRSDWYQIKLDGVAGWVAASVTIADGECDPIPVVRDIVVQNPVVQLLVTPEPPPTQPPQPEQPSQPQPTLAPEQTPESAPTQEPDPTQEPEQQPIEEAKPDLTIASILEPRFDSRGHILPFVIENRGRASSGSFVALVSSGGVLVSENHGMNLAPNETQEYHAELGFDPGVYQLTISVDSLEREESRLDNNVREYTLTVPEPMPDLVIHSLSHQLTEDGYSYFSMAVANRGQVVAENFRVMMNYGCRGCEIYRDIDTLPPGNQYSFSTNLEVVLPGDYELVATADCYGTVAELREDTNGQGVLYTVPEGAIESNAPGRQIDAC